MGYNSQAAYFQTRNMQPHVAAIVRANKARSYMNNNNVTSNDYPIEEEEELETPLYRFFYNETLATKYPQLADMVIAPTLKDTYIHSCRNIRWKCSNGHKFSKPVNLMIQTHEQALTTNTPTCHVCVQQSQPAPPVQRTGWSVQTKYPELAEMFQTKNRTNTALDSIAKAKWECANNHVFSQTIKHMVQQHEQALRTNTPTCHICAEWETYKPANKHTVNPNTPRTLYIHEIRQANKTIGYKYGIAINVNKRRKQQQHSASPDITLTTVYTHQATSQTIQTLETQITRTLKQENHTKALTREQLPDGWTETTTHTLQQLTTIINSLI